MSIAPGSRQLVRLQLEEKVNFQELLLKSHMLHSSPPDQLLPPGVDEHIFWHV